MMIDGLITRCCSDVGLDYLLKMSKDTHIILQILIGRKKLIDIFKDFRIQLLEIDTKIFQEQIEIAKQ